jgi:hypothetical protein
MDVIIDRYINGDLSTDRMLGLIEELKREAGM